MPIYEAVCPVQGEVYEELYLAGTYMPETIPCPHCDQAHPRIPSIPARMLVTGETTSGAVEVMGKTFANTAQAEAWAGTRGMVLQDTRSKDWKDQRIKNRDALDSYYKSMGYGDKDGFRRRSAIEAPERAIAARERYEKTGSTDSTGLNERVRAMTQALKTNTPNTTE